MPPSAVNAAIYRELGEIKTSVNNLVERVESVYKKIEGNGRPGLTEIVSNQQMMLEDHRHTLQTISEAMERSEKLRGDAQRASEKSAAETQKAIEQLADKMNELKAQFDAHVDPANAEHKTTWKYIVKNPVKAALWFSWSLVALIAVVEVNNQTNFVHLLVSSILKTP